MLREPASVRHSARTLATSACLAFALTGAAFAFGSIAVDDSYADDEDIGYGYSSGHDIEAAASAGALEECKSSDNAKCRVVLTYKTCGALASFNRKFGVGEGATKQIAEQAATRACDQSACKILVSECEGN